MVKDQYECYENLPKLLKRFSLESKVQYSYSKSMEVYEYYQINDFNKIRVSPHPWELETFTMLAFQAEEYRGPKELSEKQFIKMINAIREEQPSKLEGLQGVELINNMFPLIGLSQFAIQEKMLPFLYRFSCLFEDDDDPVKLKTVFQDTFSCPYLDFAVFARIMMTLMLGVSAKLHMDVNKCVFRLMDVLPTVFQALTITREEYNKLTSAYSENKLENLVSCLCPSITYPFITYGDIMAFPLPHLLMRACTTSLLYRITMGNDAINQGIGRHCLEKYLKRIIDESDAYDDVSGEVPFIENQNKKYSSDVIARKGNQVLMLENKFLRPNLKLRYLGGEALDKTVDRISDGVIELYTAMKKYKKYDPFQLQNITDKDLWGVLVLFEDPYVSREQCMHEAANKIGIELESSEYMWLIQHIRIMSLYNIELYSLSGQNICEFMKITAEKNEGIFDIDQHMTWGAKYTNKNALKFQSTIKEMAENNFQRVLADI